VNKAASVNYGNCIGHVEEKLATRLCPVDSGRSEAEYLRKDTRPK